MKIERCYLDRPGKWEEIPENVFLDRTEWAGYWKKGTALQALKDAGEIRTPYAAFRIASEATQLLDAAARRDQG